MNKIIHFVPKDGATAQSNISNFIAACRPLLASYPKVHSWEMNDWDLDGVVRLVGRGTSRVAAVFNRFKNGPSDGQVPMSMPILEFAKAYFLYRQALRPTNAFHVRLVAVRALEQALLATVGTSQVELSTAAVFQVADNLLRENYGEGASYRFGRELTILAGFLSEKRLVAVPFQFQSSIARAQDRNRVGVEADLDRKRKLPSEAALEALPQCFRYATDPVDVMVSSVAAILMAAPDRISEVFKLPVDCEVEQQMDGKPCYGLRWWPSKGAEPMVKWIPQAMVDIVKEAIARLRRVTQPARDVAIWYELNPTKLFINPELEGLREKEYLSPNEVQALLGLKQTGMLPILGQSEHKVRSYNVGKSQRLCMKYADVEQFVLSMLPSGFPYYNEAIDLKYGKALLVFRHNEWNSGKATSPCMIIPVGTNKINDLLGARANCKPPVDSIFSKMGFTEQDGSPIQITTHQFRHWLNTLAHRGGMSQLDIAKWSGRKDIRQNQAYDHMTGGELLEMARTLTQDDPRLFGSLAELAAQAPVFRSEFMELQFPTAHVTEIGFCIHDYTMLPCQKHRDCINCTEHICVKGDHQKTERVRLQLELAEEQLRRAEEALADGTYGSERWREHHQASVKRLRELFRVLVDPAIPEGALIRTLNADEFSPIQMAIQDRLGNSHLEVVDELRGLLPALSGGQ